MSLTRFQACITALSVLLAIDGFAAAPASAQQAVNERPQSPPRNPSPQKGHEVTFRFTGLPGSLTQMSAHAHFEVSNLDCIPLDTKRAVGGVRLPPEFQMDLLLQRRDDGAYVTSLYEDALADADLFGLGVCRWRTDTVTVNFRSATTAFVGGTSIENLRKAGPTVQHYLAKDFTEKPKVGDWVFGEKPDHYLTSLGPQFTLTVSSRSLR